MSDKQKRVKAFLGNISQIESRGGEDTTHPEMKSGIHKGTSAIGRYGLMPNTVSEVLNRMRIGGTLTPELDGLRGLGPEDMKKALETNPALEDQIAESLAGRVLDRQQDEEKAAYSWNQGHNLTPDAISQRPYKDSDYVQKYNAIRKLTGEEPEGE